MTSVELHYLKDKEGHFILNINGEQYMIDFNSMEQTNIVSKRWRYIKRRPYDSKELQRVKDEKRKIEEEMQRKAELAEAIRLQRMEEEKLRKEIERQREADLKEEKRLQKIDDEKRARELEMQRKVNQEEAKRLEKMKEKNKRKLKIEMRKIEMRKIEMRKIEMSKIEKQKEADMEKETRSQMIKDKQLKMKTDTQKKVDLDESEQHANIPFIPNQPVITSGKTPQPTKRKVNNTCTVTEITPIPAKNCNKYFVCTCKGFTFIIFIFITLIFLIFKGPIKFY